MPNMMSPYPASGAGGHPMDSSDIENKFAILFSPATPRATPTSSPRLRSVRTLPPPSHFSPSHDKIGTTNSASDGWFAPVSPSADPLAPSSKAFPSQSETASAKDSQPIPADETSSMRFFNDFTKEAKHASELNRKDYLDELLLHEDDPLYWVKHTVVYSKDGYEDFGDSSSCSEDHGNRRDDLSNKQSSPDPIGIASSELRDVNHNLPNNSNNNGAGIEMESSDQKHFWSRDNFGRHSERSRSPSLPPLDYPTLAADTPEQTGSTLSLPLPSNLDYPSQILEDRSELPSSSLTSTTHGQNSSTLSTVSSRLISSLLSSSRISAPSTSPSAHGPLDTLFATKSSAALPKLQHARDASSHPTSPALSRSQTSTGSMSIPRRQHSDGVPPVAVSISHRTPFAPHPSFIPPSGAPGFSGDDHEWDKGYSKDYDAERPERRSVLLMERKEGDDYVGVLDVALADLIRPYLPALARLPRAWTLLYSLDQHGVSLRTLYNRSENQRKKSAPTSGALVTIKDSGDTIFGAWIGEPIRLSKGAYYGGGDAFLWKFTNEHLNVYKWTGKNDYVSLCEPHFISFGGGDGQYGLYLDDSLLEGSSARCPTFDNDPLCSSGPKRGGAVIFECVGLEIWTVG